TRTVFYDPATMGPNQVVVMVQAAGSPVLAGSLNLPAGAALVLNRRYNPVPEHHGHLCNAVGADLSLNLPLGAPDACVQALAQMVAQRLATGRTVYLELCNEPWNTGFPQYHYFFGLAFKLNVPGKGDVPGVLQAYASEANRLFTIFQTAFNTAAQAA